MKTSFTLIVLFFLLSACSGSSKQTIFIHNQDEVLVKICVNTTKDELANMKQVLMSERNIDFNFDQTTFSSNGKIDQLDFVVKGPEGYNSHVQADLYMTDEYHGFKRDFREGATQNFHCGAMD